MGRKLKNLDGQRFGRLTVLRYAGVAVTPSGTRRQQWVCRCICGNETTVDGAALTSGNTKSCGCLKRDAVRTVDQPVYIGKVFGGLQALAVLEKHADVGTSRILCRCMRCGNVVVRSHQHLTVNKPQSCGCLGKATGGKETRICQICGKEFEVFKSLRRVTCSPECAKKYHHDEKSWCIESPSGDVYQITNLRQWAIKNYTLFEPDSTNPEASVKRITNGLATLRRAVERPDEKFSSRCSQYKGWKYKKDRE